MRSLLFRTLTVAALAVAISACAGSSEDTASGSPSSRDELAGAMAKALCANIGGCCSAKQYAYDEAKCTSLMTTFYGSLLPDVGSTATYDPQKGGDCVAEMSAAAKTCGTSSPGADSACATMFVGSTPPGGTCGTMWDCAPVAGGVNECWFEGKDGETGTCVFTPRGKAGDPCGSTCTDRPGDEECGLVGKPDTTQSTQKAACYTNDGLYCSLALGSSTYSCAPIAKLGGACTTSDGCEGEAFCNAGKCEKPLPLGSPCSFGARCEGGYCDSKTKTCQPSKALGEPCDLSEQCGEGNQCDHEEDPSTCEKSPGAGSTQISKGICAGSSVY